jgi:WD40 repeat protein
VDTGETVQTLDGYAVWVGRVAFTPNGLVAAESYENYIEFQAVNAVLTANVPAGPPTFSFNGHTNLINAMVISPDGSLLASTGWDGTTRLWDTVSGALRHTLVGHQAMVWTGAFSPDGTRLATGSLTDVRLWNVETGQPLITLIGHASWVTALAFSPDGHYLATASFQEVWVWDARTGQRILQISGHPQWVSSLAFSPDSRTLATGGGADDYAVRLFEMPTGRGLAILPGHQNVVGGLAFNPNGSLLASGSRDGVIRVWDMAAFKLLAELTGHALWLDGTVRGWGISNQ